MTYKYDNKNDPSVNSKDGVSKVEFNSITTKFAGKIAGFLVDGKIDAGEVRELMAMANLAPETFNEVHEELVKLLPSNNDGKLFTAEDLANLSKDGQEREFAGIKMGGIIDELVNNLSKAGFDEAKLGNLPRIAKELSEGRGGR